SRPRSSSSCDNLHFRRNFSVQTLSRDFRRRESREKTHKPNPIGPPEVPPSTSLILGSDPPTGEHVPRPGHSFIVRPLAARHPISHHLRHPSCWIHPMPIPP